MLRSEVRLAAGLVLDNRIVSIVFRGYGLLFDCRKEETLGGWILTQDYPVPQITKPSLILLSQ
jgi:hypothetical protein